MVRTVQLLVNSMFLIVSLLVVMTCSSGSPLFLDAHDNGNSAPQLILFV
jgi:hypothetical protein